MDLLTTARLKEALQSRGCPICRIGEETARRYLSSILHEFVNDLTFRLKLVDSWGFCRRHAWGFLSLEQARFQGDGMSTANLAQWQIGRVLELLRQAEGLPARRQRGRWLRKGGDLEAFLRPRLEPSRECPACDSQHRSEQYALEVLFEHLREEGEVTRLFRNSSGLCLAHLRAALEARDGEAGTPVLLDTQRARLEELHGELEEYLRKHDYRFSDEPYGPETDAFVKATEFLAGLWWDLPGRGPVDSCK